MLNLVDDSLCSGSITCAETALSIVEQHFSIAHHNNVVQTTIVTIHATIVAVAGTENHLEWEIEGLSIQTLTWVGNTNILGNFLLFRRCRNTHQQGSP